MPTKRVSSILTVALFLPVLALLEAIFRIVLPQPEFTPFNRINYTQLVGSPKEEDRKPLQHISYTIASEPDGVSFVHELNLYGFRDRDWKSAKSARRVIFVGDSYVEGFMAAQHETIPMGFEGEAKKHGVPLDVLNMAINAAGFPEYLKLCRDAIPLFNPDDVVVVCYVNDFPPPAFESQWLQEPPMPERPAWYVPRAVDAGLRVWRNEPVPFAWHSAPFQYFAPLGAPANPWTGNRDTFEAIVEPRIATAMKAGRFNPFMVNEIHWSRRFLTLPFDASEYVARLKEYASHHSARLWIVYIPCRYQLSDYYLQFARTFCEENLVSSLMSEEFQVQAKTLGVVCTAEGVPFLDLTSALKAREDSGIKQFWEYDAHMRGESYLFAGSQIWQWWHQQTEVG